MSSPYSVVIDWSSGHVFVADTGMTPPISAKNPHFFVQ